MLNSIETAVRAEAAITSVVINNFTIALHGASMPTAMECYGAGNQGGEYADIARACGAKAIKVEKPEGIASALADAQRANKDGKTAVIEIITRQDTRFSWYNNLLKQGAQ